MMISVSSVRYCCCMSAVTTWSIGGTAVPPIAVTAVLCIPSQLEIRSWWRWYVLQEQHTRTGFSGASLSGLSMYRVRTCKTSRVYGQGLQAMLACQTAKKASATRKYNVSAGRYQSGMRQVPGLAPVYSCHAITYSLSIANSMQAKVSQAAGLTCQTYMPMTSQK